MTTPRPTTAPVGLRRRTTPLETLMLTHSCLPSPPDDDMDASSDDTITLSGKKSVNGGQNANGHGVELTSGIPNERMSPIPSIASRMSTPAARATSGLHSPQSSPNHHRRMPSLSPSDSSDDDDTITDAAYAQAHISSTSAWTDLPVLITFISPAVALFTGGDYLRDVLLTCFLVWYLHQLIKVPWDIYLASLPPPSSSFTPAHQRRRPRPAFTHLRTTRILALFLSALTPFLGAWLLKLGTMLLATDALSWFSMSVFVLAAGVRPWRHLTHLLLTRTDALHLAVHRPSHLRPAFLGRLAAPYGERERERQRQREIDRARIETLENEIVALKSEMNALGARARTTAKAVKDVDRRAGTIEGRVEVLERHGNGLGQSGVGVWDGLGMIGAGVINVVHGMVCVVFPFMAGRGPDVGSKVGSGGKKKAKKLRRVVNNLPPVPEADESVVDGKPASEVHLDGTGQDCLGVCSSEGAVGALSGAVDMVTWPMRAMRGVSIGYFKAVAER
ncbi:hypothetical protein FRC08_016949 [Ceratobasidium sp. 394]|nr:hypothetical protein FRC08_016949 [Ceratobasidium sp. 394]KAG9099333.1 hypothetical protein FS749_001478 [Ceratobasidium sp. UAMH 11750]